MCSYSEGCVLSHDKSGVGMVICSVGLRSGYKFFFKKNIFDIIASK
jgi:hydrogenase maturation factor HypE